MAATRADDGSATHLELHEVDSVNLNRAVPVAALVPGDQIESTALPLLISLDGGVGDRNALVKRQQLYDTLFLSGVLPPLIVVSFSGGAPEFYTGAWERWILDELPAWVGQRFGKRVDANSLLLAGLSAGGYGVLKLGFKYPERFRAIAALEPVVLPTLDWPEQHRRDSWWMLTESARAVWGEPFPRTFLTDHPPNIVQENASAIRESGIEIYLEVGDEDLLNLQDGAEFLHRCLWNADIAHEYRLTRWADHGGPCVEDRLIDAHMFLGAALAGGKLQPRDLPLTANEEAFVAYVHSGGPARGEAPPENASQGEPHRELSVMAKLWEPLRAIAVEHDPTMSRRFGRLSDPDDCQ